MVDERLLAMWWEEMLDPHRAGQLCLLPWRFSMDEPKPIVHDWMVLCHHCRDRHRASEVPTCMALPTRKAPAERSTSSTSSALAAGLLTPYSEIWAFLTATAYPNGAKRRTGRLSLSCESASLRLSVTDEETGLYATFQGSSLDDCLLAFEAGLAAEEVPWRESKYAKGRK